MAQDEEDLLGGLPRTRPGVRSGKRSAGRPPRPPTPPQRPRRRPPRKAPPRPPEPSSPVGDAARLAAGAASGMLRLGGGVTRELLRRLPRP